MRTLALLVMMAFGSSCAAGAVDLLTRCAREAVRRIFAETADAGEPIERFFGDRELAADLLTQYYTDHRSGFSWVAEENGEVCGYLLGCDHTKSYGKALAFRILPRVVTRALEAVGHRPAFGLNWDPSHFVWQDLDPVGFLCDFRDRIYHVDCKDAKRQVGNGRNGRLGSHLPWADPRRGWDFVSTGHGDVPWEACFRMLNTIGYSGPISVEWEDAGMDRLVGAPEALAFVRRLAFDPPSAAFDAAFSSR